jgi:hypothetical protein
MSHVRIQTQRQMLCLYAASVQNTDTTRDKAEAHAGPTRFAESTLRLTAAVVCGQVNTCRLITPSNFYFLTEVSSVMSESHFLSPDITTWTVGATVTAVCRHSFLVNRLLPLFCFRHISFSAAGIISIGNKLFYTVHLDTNLRLDATKRKVSYWTGAARKAREGHSTGFVHAQ